MDFNSVMVMKMFAPQFRVTFKVGAKYLLATIFSLCSLWLVWGVCIKFLSGSTTVVRQQDQKDYLPLPRFLLCNKERYNKKELVSMDLPEDFFDNRYPDVDMFRNRNSFPDLNSTWQRATWSWSEFEIAWSRYEGREGRPLPVPLGKYYHFICQVSMLVQGSFPSTLSIEVSATL